VIAGVLVALAVDGWISDLHDRQTESVYLELLARDIEGIRHQADLQLEFEKEKIETAARAYAALTTSDPRTKRTEIYSLNDIRRNVLFRMRIAATGQALAERTVDEINDIATAIADELNGR